MILIRPGTTIRKFLYILFTLVFSIPSYATELCSMKLEGLADWVEYKTVFKNFSDGTIGGKRNEQLLHIEYHGIRRPATPAEKIQITNDLLIPDEINYRSIPGTFEQAEQSIPWFLSSLDKINYFVPEGGKPSNLDIVIRLNTNKNMQLSWYRRDRPEDTFYKGNRIIISLNVTLKPLDRYQHGIRVPKEIIQTVFSHEYGHSIFTQLLRSRGLDYDEQTQKLKKLIDNRFLTGHLMADRESIDLVNESVWAYTLDPTNKDSLVRQSLRLRNLVSPYSELFADTVDVLAGENLRAHTEAINFYIHTTEQLRATDGYSVNFINEPAGSPRSFFEQNKGLSSQELQSYHQALDPVRAFLGSSGLVRENMTTAEKQKFLNKLIDAIIEEIKVKEKAVTADVFPAAQMNADLISRLKN